MRKGVKNYGTSHAMQNAEFSENASKNAYNLKAYTMPSGKIIMLQGYENLAIDDLLNKENITEDDIVNERTKVPEIWYNDEKGERKRHFVDFYIPSQHRCVEIKSTWTFAKNKEAVLSKQKSAKESGFNYEIRIYNPDGSIVEIIN